MKPLRNNKDHTELICDISEITALFTDATSLDTFLQEIVEMIAKHMHSEICSIYLYREESKELILRATKGLNREFIEKVRLKLGEGLTGLALKELRPICEHHASKNPNFRYFEGLGEENFESFLAVPIQRGSTMIGAIVVQSSQKDYFSEPDINAMRAISSQLAYTIEMTSLILALEREEQVEEPKKTIEDLRFIKGKVGAPGFAVGEAVVLNTIAPLAKFKKAVFEKSYTLDDFHAAVKITAVELEQLQQSIEEKLSDVASLIFAAQILMLKDQVFIDSIVHEIQNGTNPPEAIIHVVDAYVKKFEQIPNPYLREKSFDVRDIGRRLLENITGEDADPLNYENTIIIAQELLPSDALKLSSQKVKGVVLLSGGATSHLSILARSLGLPLVIADVPELLAIPQKTKVYLDADEGNVYVDPADDILETFRAKEEAQQQLEDLKSAIHPETRTMDGVQIKLMANVNLLGDGHNAVEFKAEGVGLYRTEFPFIVRNNFPSEEEQFVIYEKLVETMPGKEITFRTLDIGGDKVLSYFEHHLKEKNPYLGMRSIRFSLQHSDIFSQQIRAILRSGAKQKVRIMFPMISSIDEFREAKKIVLQCIKSLKKHKIPCCTRPQIGLMIELPSVLEIIDELAKEADFFSIGTNDFIQYMLAVDRTNEKVSDLYIPHHPAILRGLKKVVDAAVKRKIDVSVCGDMAHQEKFMEYLIGIGVRKLSVDSNYIPRIQSAIGQIHTKKARKKTEALLKQSRLKNILKILERN